MPRQDMGPRPEEEMGLDIPFNPDTEISDADWEELDKQFAEYKQKGLDTNLVKQAAARKIVSSGREIIDMGGFSWRSLERYAASAPNFGSAVHFAANEKIVFPDKNPVSDPKSWKAIEDEIKSNRKFNREMGNYGDVVVLDIMDAKIVFPDKKIDLEPEEINIMFKELQKHREDGNWNSFISMAASMRVIFPDKQILVPGDWAGIRKGLQKCKESVWHILDSNLREVGRDQKNWDGFINGVASAKILAAEEVKVTDRGLEIRMPGEKVE